MVHRNYFVLGLMTIGVISLSNLFSQAGRAFSRSGVNYENLTQQLKAKRWDQADQETKRLILQISQDNQQLTIGHDWLTAEGVKNFPCQEIQTLDRLWKQHSTGQYGFSRQLSLWQRPLNYEKLTQDSNRWKAFSQTLDWAETAPTGTAPADSKPRSISRSLGALPKPIRSTADFDDQTINYDYQEFSGSAFLDRAQQCGLGNS
jgi:hypothetical protein